MFLSAPEAVMSGLLQMPGRGGEWSGECLVPGKELRCDTENGMDELTLTDRIALRDPVWSKNSI
jgi:hypothetical protein